MDWVDPERPLHGKLGGESHRPELDGPAFYAYSTNYLIDVQAGIIVDVEATPTLRTAEVKATRTMIERVEERFALKPERLIGDMAYGAAPMLGWLVEEKQIAPHI